MPDFIEFDVHPGRDGILKVPEEYRREIDSSDLVHVMVSKVNGTSKFQNGAIQELLDHPFFVLDFKAPSRDELYEDR